MEKDQLLPENRIDDTLKQGIRKIEMDINKIYIMDILTPNPLVNNKGNPKKLKMLPKIKTCEFNSKIVEEILEQKKETDCNSNMNYIDEEIHIPCSEGSEIEKYIKSYFFGFSEHLSNKTMTRLNLKNKKFNNYKKKTSSTPLNNSKDFQLTQKNISGNMLNKTQKNFKNVCQEFKGNYFEEVLKDPKIFLQYIDISNSEDEITKKMSFRKKAAKNELNKSKFPKDLKLYENKKTLVLDMDETLISSSTYEIINYDLKITLAQGKINETSLRPFLFEFLTEMKNYYELIILTAAEEDYASKVLDFIEKDQKFFSYRLFKHHCIVKQKFYLFKNLNVLAQNRLIKDIIIVDNCVRNFALFICNGIPIIEYRGSNDDFELCKLCNLLITMSSQENFTEFTRHNIIKYIVKNE